jgi:hypothetical protein
VEADAGVVVGFDWWVNQRLLAPTPPRRIRILSWAETLTHFADLVAQLQAAVAITRCTSLQVNHYIYSMCNVYRCPSDIGKQKKRQ